jgi:hypothetical protein
MFSWVPSFQAHFGEAVDLTLRAPLASPDSITYTWLEESGAVQTQAPAAGQFLTRLLEAEEQPFFECMEVEALLAEGSRQGLDTATLRAAVEQLVRLGCPGAQALLSG